MVKKVLSDIQSILKITKTSLIQPLVVGFLSQSECKKLLQ